MKVQLTDLLGEKNKRTGQDIVYVVLNDISLGQDIVYVVLNDISHGVCGRLFEL
jgi:hypothetical protein